MAANPRRFIEAQIQAAIIKLLQLKALPSVIWYAVPNGEKRDKITAARLKRLGVAAGVPDIALVLPNGKAAFIEVKQPGGRLSLEQVAFASRCFQQGIPHAVVTSVDEAERVLWDWLALKGPAPVAARAA